MLEAVGYLANKPQITILAFEMILHRVPAFQAGDAKGLPLVRGELVLQPVRDVVEREDSTKRSTFA